MRTFSSLHMAAMLGLTICSGLSLGAGCAMPQEDSMAAVDAAEVEGEEGDVTAEDPADTEAEDVGVAQEALAVPLDQGWISGFSGSRWRKWHSSTTWDRNTQVMRTTIRGYRCAFGTSCGAEVSATTSHNVRNHTSSVSVTGGGSATYRNGTRVSNSLNSHGRGVVQSYFRAMYEFKGSTVGHGHGRHLSETWACLGSVLEATGGWIGTVAFCGGLITADALSGFVATAGAAAPCAAAAFGATGLTAYAIGNCGANP